MSVEDWKKIIISTSQQQSQKAEDTKLRSEDNDKTVFSQEAELLTRTQVLEVANVFVELIQNGELSHLKEHGGPFIDSEETLITNKVGIRRLVQENTQFFHFLESIDIQNDGNTIALSNILIDGLLTTVDLNTRDWELIETITTSHNQNETVKCFKKKHIRSISPRVRIFPLVEKNKVAISRRISDNNGLDCVTYCLSEPNPNDFARMLTVVLTTPPLPIVNYFYRDLIKQSSANANLSWNDINESPYLVGLTEDSLNNLRNYRFNSLYYNAIKKSEKNRSLLDQTMIIQYESQNDVLPEKNARYREDLANLLRGNHNGVILNKFGLSQRAFRYL